MYPNLLKRFEFDKKYNEALSPNVSTTVEGNIIELNLLTLV